MSLHIRLARAADYPSIVSIHNRQNEPDFHTSTERLRSSDARFAQQDEHFRRYVAEQDGDLIATGTLHSNWGGQVLPKKYWVLIHVREDHRHTDTDTQILHHAVHQVEGDVAEVWTCIREDFVPMAGFLHPKRFEEQYRSWGSHLDLRAFDPTQFDPLVTRLSHEGINLISYEEFDPAGTRAQELIAMQRELEEDAVFHEPVIPKRHDDITSPDTLRESVMVAVTDDGTAVGLASLVGPPWGKNKNTISCGFTGVARDYRNRGIATALKSHTAAIAKRLEFIDLNAGGGGVDTPMLRVNRKLGFLIEPAWITFAKRY